MSRRITLTDFEIRQLVRALRAIRNAISLDYSVIDVGKDYCDQLIEKLQPTNTNLDTKGDNNDN